MGPYRQGKGPLPTRMARGSLTWSLPWTGSDDVLVYKGFRGMVGPGQGRWGSTVVGAGEETRVSGQLVTTVLTKWSDRHPDRHQIWLIWARPAVHLHRTAHHPLSTSCSFPPQCLSTWFSSAQNTFHFSA